jgi:hypothetical protein
MDIPEKYLDVEGANREGTRLAKELVSKADELHGSDSEGRSLILPEMVLRAAVDYLDRTLRERDE